MPTPAQIPIPKELDPRKTMLVFKDKTGKEVGRIAACSPRANDYATNLAMRYKGGTVDYVHDEDAALFSALH